MAFAAGLSFQRVFTLSPLLPVVAVAALMPVLLSALWTGRMRWPLPAALAASLAMWLLTVGATVFHGSATGGVLPNGLVFSGIWQGLTHGWWQVLATVPPADATAPLLTGVSLLTWLAALLAAEAALRVDSALLPPLAPLAVFVLGLMAGASGPGSDLPEASAIAALVLLLMLVRAAAGSAEHWRRRVAVGVPLVTGVVVASTLLGPRLPYAHVRAPFDPRTLVNPAHQVASAIDPLDQAEAWMAKPRTKLFDVAMAGTGDLRLVALDGFDGHDWLSTAQYVPTGSRVPEAPAAPDATNVATETVTQRFVLTGIDGPWLPALTRPATVTGTAVDVDLADGQLLSGKSVTAGTAYTVVSKVPQYTQAQLRAANPATDAVAKAALGLPAGLPPVVTATARAATQGSGFPYQQAARLADYLRQTETYDLTAPTGHTYGHIAYFLGTSHRGSSEPYAVAFALMARTLGLPARVVVGFRPGARDASGPGSGAWSITGADVLVWPEVDFAGLGWVPFYPTPDTTGAAGAQQLAAGESGQRQRIDRTLSAAPLPKIAPVTGRPPAAARNAGSAGVPVLLWLGPSLGVVAAAACAYLLAAALRPRRRLRRLRQAPAAADAVAGAWLATVDRLRLVGLDRVTAQTSSEVARYGTDRLGGEMEPALAKLATLADQVAFSGQPPDPSAPATAWQLYDGIHQRIGAVVPWRTRLGHRLRPRNVLGPSRRTADADPYTSLS
jgi:transglutaminase-like putative cysteine protease